MWSSHDRSEINRSRQRLLRVEARTHAQLLLDALLDLMGDIRVLAQEGPHVLLALTQLLTVVRVPGASLANEALLPPDVDQRSLAGDALAIDDVELGLLERRGHLVLDDLH